MNKGVLACVKNSVQYRQNSSAGVRVINRRAKYEAIGFAGLFDDPVYNIVVKRASARLSGTGAAGSAVPYRFVAQEQDFCLDAGAFQSKSDFVQCRMRASFGMGTAVK